MALAVSPLLAAAPASADEIYRWVDADGAVHFSDARPLDDDLAVTTLELAEFASAYDPAADPYSILNQAARTHEKWQAIEAAGRERATAQPIVVTLPATAPQTETRYYRYGRDYYVPVQPVLPGGDPSRIARQQYRALDELDLTGPQPYSINSGAHRDRVERSQSLPLVTTPTPRNR
jgi:hypothetical protein